MLAPTQERIGWPLAVVRGFARAIRGRGSQQDRRRDVPAVVLVIIWWKRGHITLDDVVPLVPFFAAGVSLGLVTVWMEKNFVGAAGEEWSLTPLDRVLLAGECCGSTLLSSSGLIRWRFSIRAFDQCASVVAISVSAGGVPCLRRAMAGARRDRARTIGGCSYLFRSARSGARLFRRLSLPLFVRGRPFSISRRHCALALAAAGLAPLLARAEQARRAREPCSRPCCYWSWAC